MLKNNQAGFTLVELLVVCAMAGIVLTGALSIHQAALGSYTAGSNKIESTQSARLVVERMSREIRTAVAITAADATTLTFTPPAGGANITYSLVTSTLQRNGATVAGGVRTLSLSYRDGSDNALTPLPLTAAQRANVRRVIVTLQVGTEDTISANRGNDLVSTAGSSIRLRNL